MSLDICAIALPMTHRFYPVSLVIFYLVCYANTHCLRDRFCCLSLFSSSKKEI
jgi:hypothetical protein